MVCKKSVPFPPAGEERTVHLYLPDNYDLWDERYPVIYFFDGHNLFYDSDATYGTSWGLKTFLDTWAKEVIVVGIECGHKPGQRLDEYSPYPMEIMDHHAKGLGNATLDWIINTLKPEIDRTFRTWPHREATAIAGSSMGGLMSLYGVVKCNEVFGKAACLSPSIFPCLGNLLSDIANTPLHPDTRVWLSFGNEEVDEKRVKAFNELLGALEDKHIFCSSTIQEHGGHNEQSWGRLVPSFMSYLWLES